MIGKKAPEPVRVLPWAKCPCGCDQFVVVSVSERLSRDSQGGLIRVVSGAIGYCARFGHRLFYDAASGLIERTAPDETPAAARQNGPVERPLGPPPETPPPDLRSLPRRTIT